MTTTARPAFSNARAASQPHGHDLCHHYSGALGLTGLPLLLPAIPECAKR